MKRLGFGFAFFVTFGISVFAQQGTPIIGYDRVPWGSTVQAVTQAYPGLQEVPSEEASVGVREFTQTNVGGGIASRKFYFYENKLYRVFVGYDDVNADTVRAILDRLVSIYGRFNSSDGPTNSSQGGIMNSRTQFVRFFNENMTIVVNVVDLYNQFNFHVGAGVGIVYYDETIQDRIGAALRQQRADRIQL
ncbi:MAG: hypothetical protein FWE09_02980 [Treponema sp.]|nr:hypothetical protein [Treponema sp.]